MIKHLREYVSEISDKFQGNKNTIITSSLVIYAVLYFAIGLGGFSFQSQPAIGYLADPDKPSNPQPADNSFIEGAGPQTVTLSARYTDSDGHSGTLTFFDGDTDNSIGSCSVNDGERCSVSWSASHGDNWWYAVADDDGDGASTRSDDWVFTINRAPDKTNSPETPNQGNTVYSESTELSLTVSDPDSDDLETTFYDNYSLSETVGPDTSGSIASYNSDNLNRGETYKWWAEVSDGWNSTKTSEWSFYVNDLPNVYDAQPIDITEQERPEISIRANDDNSDTLTAYFFNGSETLMGKETFAEDERASVEYTSDTEIGDTYQWTVNVSDGFENSTNTYSFTRTTNINTRVDQRIDYEYSSIILSDSSTQEVFFEVENNIDDVKELRTYLEGVNAVFPENNQQYIDYTLQPESSRSFLVRISPDTLGDSYLNITTENRRFGVNTSTSIPVTVKNYTDVSGTSEVSGIGTIQLIMLLLVSAYLYSVRL